eukprot:CAMPEP_0184394922 /NCGR_PEP_ID=MMETSP0007-20130409/41787_1 /TAXON_ID=97485 /ORGANISM="Prymnesium parvum, Strain Texoma1" /LENGTH=40 /DNA_ID= /DNA_START= /DNA_END= /DNA_ORIENTATION=
MKVLGHLKEHGRPCQRELRIARAMASPRVAVRPDGPYVVR